MGKLNHSVGRFYLRSWATQEKIFCLQDGNIMRPNIKGVAAKNYLYKLRELSAEDVEFVRRLIIDKSPNGFSGSHENLLSSFNIPFAAKRMLKAAGITSSSATKTIEQAITQMNEDVHTGVEDRFRPYLAEMQRGKLDFIGDPPQASTFYHGIALQYLRTNHMKRIKLNLSTEQFDLFQRIANPLVHIMAMNLGYSLFTDRDTHTITILENRSGIPFITADQPIINMAYAPNDTSTPSKFELYYPISPTKAMMLLEPHSKFCSSTNLVSETYVNICNLRIAAHSYRQVFSDAPENLEAIRRDLPAYMSCFT